MALGVRFGDTGRAMSEKNVEILRETYEAWWSGDVDDVGELLAMIDGDCVSRVHSPAPDPGTWHGPDGLLELMSEWADAFDDYSMRADEFTDAGDRVLVRVVQEGRSRGSDVPVSGTFWFVYGMREGKITSLDMFASREQAQEAIGL
jgi:ketosteroid isomerase-like protein